MGEIVYGDAIHIREQAKVDAARMTQKSGNELRGARTALQQFQSSLANKRTMDAAGKNVNVITENLARSLDGATTGNFESRIQAAEQAGAASAMAAAAGVGGSSIEAYNETAQLALDRAAEMAARGINSENIATAGQRGETITGAVGSLDNSIYRADLDFTAITDHRKMGLFDRLATLGAAAAATYFGGPQAGMAVIGMAEAGQQANNGDFAGASSSLMGAVSNATGAAKSYQSTGGHYWAAAKEAPATGHWTERGPSYGPPKFGSTNLK